MPVETTRRDDVLELCLRRPDRGNALSAEMVAALRAGIAAADDPAIRLLVLRGIGRNFCTGFDLAGLDTASDGDLLLRFVHIEQMLQALHHAPVPSITLAQGRIFGAGADLFAACAWRIATPTARFAFPGARFGLVLGTRRLAGVAGVQVALDLTQRGQTIAAEAALACGLATALAAETEWDAAIAAIVTELRATPRDTAIALRAAARPDTRDADLAALVRSAALPGLRDRIAAYASQRTAAPAPGATA